MQVKTKSRTCKSGPCVRSSTRDAPLVLISELFDSHDDRDDDPEGESVEEHKSVIMHLLSQVRLGMDLTKVNTAVLAIAQEELIGKKIFFFVSFVMDQ